MISFVIRRLVLSVVLLFIISIISFFIVTLTPGSPYPWGELNPKISPEVKANFRKKFHLDRPLHEQYGLIMRDLFSGNLRSIKDDRPVMSRILERLPATVALNLTSIVISLSFGTLLGVFAARYAGTWKDGAGSFIAFLFIALPGFWITYVVVVALVKGFGVPILGTHSYGIEFPNALASGLDTLWHLLLPATILALGGIASQSRYIRASMIESLREDYIRTARSKGLSEVRVLLGHVLRNALIPIISASVAIIPLLFMGSLIVESFFSIPGLGSYLIEAIGSQDFAIVRSMVFVGSLLYIIGLILTDLCYAWADPRIRLQ